MKEWYDIEGYENLYQINKNGQVKSLDRYITVNLSNGGTKQRLIRSRILKHRNSKGASPVVTLCDDFSQKITSVCDIVINTFAKSKILIDYKDGDNTNVSLGNLWLEDSHVCKFDFQGKLKESDLTKEILEECFTYKDGQLFWKRRPPNHFLIPKDYRAFNSASAGKVAGYFNKRTDSKREGFGYWRAGLTLGGAFSNFKLHRLIFLYHKGYLPKLIDHKDRDQNNNRIENLREGDLASNGANSVIPVNNVSGFKGVAKNNAYERRFKPYRASIEANGYTFGLGNYSCPEMAGLAYNIASELLHKEFSNKNEVSISEEDFLWKGIFFEKHYHEIKNGTFDWKSKKCRAVRK